jgi:hypothetical protein
MPLHRVSTEFLNVYNAQKGLLVKRPKFSDDDTSDSDVISPGFVSRAAKRRRFSTDAIRL